MSSLRFIIIFYDLYRITIYPLKKYNSWEEANNKNMPYTYFDFLFNDFKYLNISNTINFILIIYFLKLILIIQIIPFLISFFLALIDKSRPIIYKNIYLFIFISIPWSNGWLVRNNLFNHGLSFYLVSFMINIQCIITWSKGRWLINNTISIQKYIRNWLKGYQSFNSGLRFLVFNNYSDAIKKHLNESTLRDRKIYK